MIGSSAAVPPDTNSEYEITDNVIMCYITPRQIAVFPLVDKLCCY